MTASERNPKIDSFFERPDKWQQEFKILRAIILDCGLTEEYKWMHPCYTIEGGNVVIIQGFKEYCALLFVKGALLKDPGGILIQQTENVQAARQVRFTNVQEISKLESTLKEYIREAADAEKAGLKVEYKQTTEFPTPEEFINKLESVPGLQEAFEGLTPGRQRAYLLYFSAAKQPQTREARIEKYIPQILKGKGLND
jgi:uncharacterized protein YdeI (YjbR/CyaY-like superfamily)